VITLSHCQKALAGEKVITRDGQEVTQLVKFDINNDRYQVYGVVEDDMHTWTCKGENFKGTEGNLDLAMAPKKLSGYVGIYRLIDGTLCMNAVYDAKSQIRVDSQTLAIIDLSTIEEGHGL